MTNLLDIQHKNGQQVTVENINSAVDQIGKLYDDTAKSTLGLRHNRFWGSISLVAFTDYFSGTL
jgi:hypothetical protein